MKLSLLLIAVFTIHASASVFSQQIKLGKETNGETVRDVLKVIETASDVRFFYNEDYKQLNTTLSELMDEGTLDELLVQICSKSDLNYKKMANNFVVIYPADMIQQQKVTGTVTDASTGEPMPGVYVMVEASQTGTVTDNHGNYSLDVPDQNVVLVFSFIGYNTEKVNTGTKSVLNVSLIADIKSLDEVVVIGYGTMRKKDVLGAISSVKSEDVALSSQSSVLSALEGKAAGLMIRQNSAQPGGGMDIYIRGQGSVNASNDPLIVVDGFPISEFGQPESGNRYVAGTSSILNSFNPNDIESIEVMKDASSTAIYGARAANGVILITTKRGKEGKVVLDYSGSYSFQKYENSFDVLPLNEWMQVRNEAAWEDWCFQNKVFPYGTRTVEEAHANPIGNDYLGNMYTQNAIDNVGRGTDWFDLVTRNGLIKQHNVTISGGTTNTKYLLSGNFYNHEGIIKNSGMKRYSFRTNIDQRLTRFMTLGISLTGSRILNDNTQLGDQPWENSGIIRAAIQQGPHILAIDENGNYPMNPQLATQPNPYSLLTITDKGRVDRLLVNTFLEITPLKDLKVKLKVGIDRGMSSRGSYLPKTTWAGASENGKANISEIDNNDYLMEFTADYTKTLAESHRFMFMLGASQQKTVNSSSNIGNTNFLTDAFLWRNMNAGTGTKTEYTGYTESMIASYFGRLFYSFKDRYLLTLTLRADGASIFAKNNKWATFPSASIGWNIAEEEFMSNIRDNISQLKLRFGYGQTGNSSLTYIQVEDASYSTSAFSAYVAYPGWVSGQDKPLIAVSLARLENPDLKWETTTEANFGLDFTLFKGRISGTFDVFNRVISDLLQIKPINSYHEINKVISNVGKTQSKGFEVTLNAEVLRTNNFSWKTTFNISRFKDNWKERAPDWKPSVYESANDPIRARYVRVADGIMQIGESVPAQPELIPGQIKIKDINGYTRDSEGNKVVDDRGFFQRTGEPDGIIDDADTRLIGTTDPSCIAGLSNSLSYKNIILNFHFNGMFGRKLEDPNDAAFGITADGIYAFGYNGLRSVKDRWTPERPSTTRPGSYYGYSPYGSGDFFLQDAWFIRLQNISLGYTLPGKWFRNIAAITVHADADNLFIITPYKGVDPETDSYTAAYPNVRTYTIGLNAKF